MRARILIVDDHPLVRDGLAGRISKQPDLEVCGEAADVPGALRLVASTKPDLAIIDISLKGGDGLDLIKQVRARKFETKMLVASMYDEILYAERALRAGAMGYINKQELPEDMIDAIRQVLAGQIYLSAQMRNRLLQRTVGRGPVAIRSPIESLTDRELEIFQLIGRALTTRQIAEKLHLSIKTIETHRERLKMKLKAKNAAELSRQAVAWTIENA
ncbi:MAG: response regulator transcription factor [Planctomycetes bacterium]|nr:response regulator transcription factor [Planctomycetota bacterium]MBI3848172.1 response regulator transcription factor [Planctomycetota bacterium]